jgi:tRNA A37 methylthiotransferase MiaB
MMGYSALMQRSIFFLTFDVFKDGYAKVPYSIACLMASIKANLPSVAVGFHSINLEECRGRDTEETTKTVLKHAKKVILEECWNFNYLAIGVTAWSELYVKQLSQFLSKNFSGTLILGGYEITALDADTVVREYPGASFYVKGYAETALLKILSGEYDHLDKPRVLQEKVSPAHLVSPYAQTAMLNGTKVNWETKRGCPYHCGFCEWGNASQKEVLPLPYDRLERELKVFRDHQIEKINILDGTFNYNPKDDSGKAVDYSKLLRRVLEFTAAHVNLQTRFEVIKPDDPRSRAFLDTCQIHRDRVTLEFGLQTIHKREMEVIDRKNNLEVIRATMGELNKRGIDYELSVIYGIPGQTVASFLETIEFVVENGCEKIAAYPLRIPKNSKMDKMKRELGVQEAPLDFNIFHTKASFSFTEKDYRVMSKFSGALRTLNAQKSLFNLTTNLSYIVFELTPSGSFRLKDITDHDRLYFNAPNERLKELICGHEELVLSILASSEGREVVNSIFGFLSDQTGWFPRFLGSLLEFLLGNAIWHYRDPEGHQYICQVRISDKGNIHIFKDFLNVHERVGAIHQALF